MIEPSNTVRPVIPYTVRKHVLKMNGYMRAISAALMKGNDMYVRDKKLYERPAGYLYLVMEEGDYYHSFYDAFMADVGTPRRTICLIG